MVVEQFWVSVAVVLHDSVPVTDNMTVTQHRATGEARRSHQENMTGTWDSGDLVLLQPPRVAQCFMRLHWPRL